MTLARRSPSDDLSELLEGLGCLGLRFPKLLTLKGYLEFWVDGFGCRAHGHNVRGLEFTFQSLWHWALLSGLTDGSCCKHGGHA